MNENINPKHYKTMPLEAYECVKAIFEATDWGSMGLLASDIAMVGALWFNELKYRLRAGNKDDIEQEILKAKWFADKRKDLIDGVII